MTTEPNIRPVPKGRIMAFGDVQLDAHRTFKWYNETGAEIYGWTEENGSIIKGSSGWFRTTDPEAAARMAKSNL